MNEKLRAARMKSGKTHAQVARDAKISPAAYQGYEYGSNAPSVQAAIRIADVLGVEDLRELFETDTKSSDEL